jgi:hypothetical protein
VKVEGHGRSERDFVGREEHHFVGKFSGFALSSF